MKIYFGATTTSNIGKKSSLNTNFATDVDLLGWLSENVRTQNRHGDYVSISERTILKLQEDLLKAKENPDNILNLFHIEDSEAREYFKIKLLDTLRGIANVIGIYEETGYFNQYMYVVIDH